MRDAPTDTSPSRHAYAFLRRLAAPAAFWEPSSSIPASSVSAPPAAGSASSFGSCMGTSSTESSGTAASALGAFFRRLAFPSALSAASFCSSCVSGRGVSSAASAGFSTSADSSGSAAPSARPASPEEGSHQQLLRDSQRLRTRPAPRLLLLVLRLRKRGLISSFCGILNVCGLVRLRGSLLPLLRPALLRCGGAPLRRGRRRLRVVQPRPVVHGLANEPDRTPALEQLESARSLLHR